MKSSSPFSSNIRPLICISRAIMKAQAHHTSLKQPAHPADRVHLRHSSPRSSALRHWRARRAFWHINPFKFPCGATFPVGNLEADGSKPCPPLVCEARDPFERTEKG